MTSIYNALKSIEAFLNAKEDCNADVLLFPDKPEAYHLTHPLGAILIQYGGSGFDKTQAIDIAVQERKLRFGFTLVFKSLYGVKGNDEGVLAYLDKMLAWLTGFAPDNCNRMYPVSDKFVDHNSGRWTYMMEFAATTTAVQSKNLNIEQGAPLVSSDAEYDPDGQPPA